MCNSKTSKNLSSVQRWKNVISSNLSISERKIQQMVDFVKYPVITEKTYRSLIQKRQFTFDIDHRLNKPQIKALFESLFNVHVMSVNTHLPPRKKLRVGVAQGFRPVYKRAIVTLKQGESLNFLNF